jgi:hypothetical protein
MLANMASALDRGLPTVKVCRPHGHTLSIAGGGPSLADTCSELTGYIAAVNGSLKFLLNQPVIEGSPYFCGVLDAGEHIADMLVADKAVRYYVASTCAPSVFDKLKDCNVVLWHVTPASTGAPHHASLLIKDDISIGGGCTMGLRWLNLGYVLGFRKFNLHGLDSSFRDGATHAYPDRADVKDRMKVGEYWTRPNFVAQMRDFFKVMSLFKTLEPTEINVYGDGLLQDTWRKLGAPKSAKDTALIRAREGLSRLSEGPIHGAEIGVFEEGNEVGFSRFLEGQDS